MHEVLVNRLGGLSLPRKSVVRLTDRPDMTLDVYCGHKTTIQQQQLSSDDMTGYLLKNCSGSSQCQEGSVKVTKREWETTEERENTGD